MPLRDRETRKEIIEILRRHGLLLSCATALHEVVVPHVGRLEATRAVANIVAEVDEAAKPLGNLLNKLLTVEHQERLPWILDWRLRGIDDPIALAEQLRLLIKLRRYSGSRRGRPPNLALYSFLSSVADIYKKGTRRKATAARTERKGGDPTWGPFIRFASDCARLADINPAGERALGPVWIRLRKRRIVRA